MKGFAFISGLVVIGIVAFVLVNAIIGDGGPSPGYQAAIEAQRLETASKMRHLKVIVWYGLAGILLLGLACGVGVAIWSAWQRAQLIQPHDTGLFPVVRGRAGGRTYYHDPNRQLAGTVAYGTVPDGIELQQMLPPGTEAEQLQVTTQAQAAQVVAAAAQDQKMTVTTRRLVERMTQSRIVPRLPPVTIELDDESPEEQKLLNAIRSGIKELE